MNYRFFALALISMAVFFGCIVPESNVPKLLSSSCADKDMRKWTLVEFRTRERGWLETIITQKIVICHDPLAKFWVFNDSLPCYDPMVFIRAPKDDDDFRVRNNLLTNAVEIGSAQMQWFMFDVKKSTTEELSVPLPAWDALVESKLGTPLERLYSTNIFDVVAFQRDFPECAALFFMTDKRRGNKAIFKKYRFDRSSHDYVRAFFYYPNFSVLLSTDDYPELVDYMRKNK